MKCVQLSNKVEGRVSILKSLAGATLLQKFKSQPSKKVVGTILEGAPQTPQLRGHVSKSMKINEKCSKKKLPKKLNIVPGKTLKSYQQSCLSMKNEPHSHSVALLVFGNRPTKRKRKIEIFGSS